MAVTPATWSPSSWRSRPARHQPDWPDEARAEAALAQLKAMPPLVFAGEARELQASLAEVAAGRAFLLPHRGLVLAPRAEREPALVALTVPPALP